MIRISFAAPLLALALCGCSLIEREPYRTASYFDLVPSKSEMRQDAGASSFTVVSSLQFSDRMLFKVGPDRMQFDEYNRWLANPDILLKRYLEIAFAPSASGKLSVGVKILRFDLDKSEATANCELLVTVFKNGVPSDAARISSSAKAKDESAGAFVEAMREAVADAASKIAAELKKNNA